MLWFTVSYAYTYYYIIPTATDMTICVIRVFLHVHTIYKYGNVHTFQHHAYNYCYTTLLIVVGSIYCIFINLQTIFLIYFLHEDLKNPSCSTHNAWREQAYMNIMWHSVDILGTCRFSLERPWLNTRYKLRPLAQSEIETSPARWHKESEDVIIHKTQREA